MKKPVEKARHPFLSWLQILIIFGMVIALALAVGPNSRPQAGRPRAAQEERLAALVETEAVRGQQLRITLTYVNSDDYVADYARNEGGMILPGEKRVVPLPHPLPLTPTPMPTPIPALSVPTSPWQAWWILFFDSPPPGR